MAIEVGTAYISILPSTSKLAPGIKRELTRAQAMASVEGSKAGKGFASKFTAALSGLKGIAGKALAGGLAGAAAGVAALGVAGVKTAGELEQSQLGFETMLGSAKAANKMMNDIKKTAAKTPFELKGLTQASQQLLAMGFNAKQVIPTLTTIGDAAAGLGRGQEGIDTMVRALGQMQAKGKVQSEELLQMTEVGVPALKILANEFGVSTAKMQEMVTKGAVPASKAVPALLKGMKEGSKGIAGETTAFGGLMEKQSTSLLGLLSTLKDTVMVGMADAIKPLMPMLREGLATAIEALGPIFEKVAGAFKSVVNGWKEGTGVGGVLRKVFAGIGTAFKIAGSIIKGAWDYVIMPVFRFMVAFVRNVLAPVFTFLWKYVIKPVFSFIGATIRTTWNYVIKPVFNAMKWFVQNIVIPPFRFLWSKVIKPVFSSIGGFIKRTWDRGIKPIFNALGNFIGDKVAPAFRRGIKAIERIWNSLKAIARKPVEFVVNTVYNKGIRKVINAIPGLPDLKPVHFATGGPVKGGLRGRDSVLSLLMPDEHVLTAAEVRKLGGHRAVERMRDLIRRGAFTKDALEGRGDIGWPFPRFANGGYLTPEQIERAKRFAWQQRGKPYIWGGVGPKGYDCSGFMSAVTNVLLGTYPYARRGTSATFPWSGFKPGYGQFTIGAFTGSPGHVAGTLAGLNLESTNGSVRVGAAARGASHPMFTRRAHLGAGGKEAAGEGGFFAGIVDTIKGFIDNIKGFVKELTTMGGWAGLMRQMIDGIWKKLADFVNSKIPIWDPVPTRLFDSGGVLAPGMLAYNASRRPESVFTEPQLRALLESRNTAQQPARFELYLDRKSKVVLEGYVKQAATDAYRVEQNYAASVRRMNGRA